MTTMDGNNYLSCMTPDERKLYDLIRRHPLGVTDPQVEREDPTFHLQKRMPLVNTLLSKCLLELFQSNDMLRYKALDGADAARLVTMASDEQLVYKAIRGTCERGIWIKELERAVRGLPKARLTKILKELQSRRLVVQTQSVDQGRKKVFIVTEFSRIDRQNEGVNVFYAVDGKELDAAFVEEMRKICLFYLKRATESNVTERHPAVTFRQIHEFVLNSGITKIPLNEDQLHRVLDTLVFDDHLETYQTATAQQCYRIAHHHHHSHLSQSSISTHSNIPSEDTAHSTAFSLRHLPCGTAPLHRRCALDIDPLENSSTSYDHPSPTPIVPCIHYSSWFRTKK